MERRLIDANRLERYAVVREDGHRYVPWLAIAEVPTEKFDERVHQAPAKLDRSQWEGCEWCKQRYCDNCFWQIKMKDSSRCKRCIDKDRWSPLVSYCSNCGRPLTEEAWAELERRIGGNDGTTDS